MDAFFASVEERDKPYLKGMPVIVGADPSGGAGRGVVSTASYAARRYGIYSATPIGKAWRLCEEAHKQGKPACVFITPEFSRYGEAAREVFAIVRRFVPDIEQTSIDEAYLNMSFSKSFKAARGIAEDIKRAIKKGTALSCSIGIAPNKMVAKIASDYQKPDGLTVVAPRKVESFLAPLPVLAIPGVGPKAEGKFRALSAGTIQDARRLSWQEMEAHFGSLGISLYERLRGIDDRPFETLPTLRKSIGKHHTFSADTRDMDAVLAVIREHAAEITATMKRKGFTAFKTVVLTVRFEDFTTATRSLTLDAPAASARPIVLAATKLLFPFFEKSGNPNGQAIRLVGVRVEKLSAPSTI